jgi:cyclic pyranopterin phosphate synthase
MKDLLDDAKDAGVNRVRLYGGEPLLHPDLPEMIRHSCALGMDTYVTTNGILLKDRIDQLFDAGLRWMTIGFYGENEKYDLYTDRAGHYARLEESLRSVRERYGARVSMQLNYVLLRSTTNIEALNAAWNFARRFDMYFHLDLYMHEIPFFTDGVDGDIAFRPDDRPGTQRVVDELVRLKQQDPERFPQSLPFVRSVTDWLILGADMRVPCDAYELLWVGADGSVQLCDVTFKLGNLHDKRLRDITYSPAHAKASIDAFELRCPNCTCKCDSRIMKHAPSLRRYGGP